MLLKINELIFCRPWPSALLIILLFMSVLGVVALLTKHLTWNGSMAAVITGTVVTWCMRLEGFLVLLFFYLSCYLVAFIAKSCGAEENKIEKKGNRRDSMQVIANALGCLIASLLFYNTEKIAALVMFGSALAEASADTWAGELGRLSPGMPVSIKTGKPVEKGTSGGITLTGLAGGMAGSALTAGFWQWAFITEYKGMYINTLIVTACGFAGCIFDSFLGASVQAIYEDSRTGKLTEREYDEAGNPQKLIRGFKWMDNDMVNMLSNIFSVLLGFILYSFFS